MPRRPATILQADVARAIRAAKDAGAAEVEVHGPDGVVIYRVDQPIIASMNKDDAVPVWSSDGILNVTIYFIECDGHVKIGKTAGEPEERLAALSTAHFRELKLVATIKNVPSSREIELHRRFAQYRVRGEWFVLSPEIQAFIDEARKGKL